MMSGATDADKGSLQLQFQKLQEQQMQKQMRRKKKQEEKNATVMKSDTSVSMFGISDDLELQLSPPVHTQKENISAGYSEELVESLNDQIRELRDETGRLYKLLSEREFENKKLKKKQEEDRLALAGGPGPASHTAATKIVDLSKRVREITAELEREKTKNKQWAKRAAELENQIHQMKNPEITPRKGERNGMLASAPPWQTEAEQGKILQESDLKQTQDRLKQTESKMTEYRNQCQNLKQELKVAHKVLANEVGEGVNIQSLLSAPNSYKGRAQQIMMLQKKVSELKSQLSDTQSQSCGSQYSLEEELLGMSTSRKNNADDRNREQLRKLDKERKEAQEKAAAELKALEEDFKDVKSKLEAAKARNKVLSNEVKSSKENMQRLLDKGKHDDELIQALMKQQEHMKTIIEENTRLQKLQEENKHKLAKEISQQSQKESNLVEQLKGIISEREAKVRVLEEEVTTLRQERNEKPSVGPPDISNRNTPRVQDLVLESPSPQPSSRLSNRSTSRQSVRGDVSDRPPSSRVTSARSVTPAAGVDRQVLDDLNRQNQEYKTLLQASEVERDKLTELVDVLQKRISDITDEITSCQTELQSQRRRSVQLEKQLGKARVNEQNQAAKSGVKQNKSKSTLSQNNLREGAAVAEEDAMAEANYEEIQTNLEIQKDENEALKAALQRTLKAKEDDLKLYQQVMEETRRVFLQGLRHYKQSQNS